MVQTAKYLIGWLAGWLDGWLAGRLAGWLAGRLAGWLDLGDLGLALQEFHILLFFTNFSTSKTMVFLCISMAFHVFEPVWHPKMYGFA